MQLLLDIGNTHTHLGLVRGEKIAKQSDLPTTFWREAEAPATLRSFIGRGRVEAVAFCSVVPRATALAVPLLRKLWRVPIAHLTHRSISGVGIKYPAPETIGQDRLANAIAVRHFYGCPAVVVDFGTAVTFDVVDGSGDYIGGIIAPGLAAMTDYLHEKTALLPKIHIREVKAVVGRNTEEAMLIGAVHGYRGLIRELILELRGELKCARLPVVATGGYADLIAAKLPEIAAVRPLLTLEGLRLFLKDHLLSRGAQ